MRPFTYLRQFTKYSFITLPKQKPCRGTARHKSVMKHALAALLLLYLADVPHQLKDNLSTLIL